MAASAGDTISKGIDSSVGGLVWVQRRNGRWWPGMIIGPDNLPQQPSSWPRSRTPVKLLGREDAIGSVDWYNIEKSKRVKAFRCGEYDEWITKANDSPKNSNKKAMKHVCRDDAIRHALKLEKTLISKKDEEYCSTDDHDRVTELVNISPLTGHTEPTVDKIRIFENNSNSTQELCLSGLSFEDPRQVNSTSQLLVHGNLQKTFGHFKEDEAEGAPKFRRFESFCLGVVREGDDLDLPKGSFLHSNLDMENSLSIQSHSNGGFKGDSSLFKRRILAQDSVKRKNRHRPLTKVLESTNEVPVPVLCDMTRNPNQSAHTGLSGNNEGTMEFSRSKLFTMSASCNNLHKRKLIFNNEALNGEIRGPETSYDSNHRLKDQNMSSSLKIQEENPVGTLFEVPFAQKGDESEDTCTAFYATLNDSQGRGEACCGEREGVTSGIAVAEWRPTGRRKRRKRETVALIPHAYFVGAENWEDVSTASSSATPLVRGWSWMWDVVVEVNAAAGSAPGRGRLTSITSRVKGEAVVGHRLAVEVVVGSGQTRTDDDVAVKTTAAGCCVSVSVVFDRLFQGVGGVWGKNPPCS